LQEKINVRSGLIISLSVSTCAIILLLYLTATRKTWQEIAKIHPVFIVIAVLLVFLKWASSCLRAELLIKASGEEMSLGKISKAVLAGGFAGSVTPFHAAGIPAQVYFFYKYGLTAPTSLAVVTAGATLSVFCFTALAPAIILTGAKVLHAGFGFRTALVGAGIGAFIVLIIFFYSVIEPEKLSKTLYERSPEFLRKNERYLKIQTSFLEGAKKFQISFRTIAKCGVRTTLEAVLLTLLFWLAGLLIIPIIILGMGYPEYFFKAFLAQTLAAFLLPFAPVPGESGFAEFTFSGLLATFLPKRLIGVVTLSWRFFTFYLTLLFMGASFLLVLKDIEEMGNKNVELASEKSLACSKELSHDFETDEDINRTGPD